MFPVSVVALCGHQPKCLGLGSTSLGDAHVAGRHPWTETWLAAFPELQPWPLGYITNRNFTLQTFISHPWTETWLAAFPQLQSWPLGCITNRLHFANIHFTSLDRLGWQRFKSSNHGPEVHSKRTSLCRHSLHTTSIHCTQKAFTSHHIHFM